MGLMRHDFTQKRKDAMGKNKSSLAFYRLSVSHPFYGDNASWA